MRAILLALILLAPTAMAGTRAAPEARDPAGDARPIADILSVWLETEDNGVRFTFEIASIPAPAPRQLYWLVLFLGGDAYNPTVGWDARSQLRTETLRSNIWGGTAGVPGPNDGLVNASVTTGTPSLVTAVIPWGTYPGLQPGARMSITAGSTAFIDGAWNVGEDLAGDRARAFVATRESVSPFPWVPTLLGITVVGSAVAFLVVRQRRARTPPPPPMDAPTPPPAPGPPPRFGDVVHLDPREKR